MNIKEQLNKIAEQVKHLLAFGEETPAETTVEQAAEDGTYTLADGTIIKVASLEVGQAVTVVTAEGEQPAPEGNHTLEDGTTITTDASGVITAVVPPAETEVETEAAQVDMAQFRAEFSALLTEKDEKIAAIEKANNALIEQNKKVLAQFSELLKVVESIGEQTPAPITEQKQAAKPMTEAEKIAAFYANKK